ncbi:hypothetical protein [Acrocarpospora phusangensis]|nr:hypothetical protein [Acrocarpospora phusangensis]
MLVAGSPSARHHRGPDRRPTWNEYVLTRVSVNDPARYTLPLGLES